MKTSLLHTLLFQAVTFLPVILWAIGICLYWLFCCSWRRDEPTRYRHELTGKPIVHREHCA